VDKQVQVRTEKDHGVPWTEVVADIYANGGSDLAVCKALGLSRKKFEAYIEKSDQFRDFIEQGREAAECWWVEKSRENLNNKDFNTQLYRTHMGHFYGYSDKSETKTETRTSEQDIAKLRQEIIDRLTDMKLVSSVEPKRIGSGE